MNDSNTTEDSDQSPSGTGDMNPGDQAPPGTPGTGEDICPECGGSGKDDQQRPCVNCGGTGKIIEAIGGA